MDGFDRDTAVERHGFGRYRAQISENWSNGRSVNGGYVAAILARAMEAEVAQAEDDSAERLLRSLTVHYLAGPTFGRPVVSVAVERSGRSLTSVSARLMEGDALIALALAAFSKPFTAAAEYDETNWPVPGPPPVLTAPPDGEVSPPFLHNFRMAQAVGPPPFGGDGPASTGGWIQLLTPRPLDAAMVVALADCWWPSPFSHVPHRVPALTIDLTVHVRAALPLPAQPVFSEFRSRLLRDGFFEEDGRLRTADGTLLAQSRQMACLLPKVDRS
jgi:acyl-CoA thioesterase